MKVQTKVNTNSFLRQQVTSVQNKLNTYFKIIKSKADKFLA